MVEDNFPTGVVTLDFESSKMFLEERDVLVKECVFNMLSRWVSELNPLLVMTPDGIPVGIIATERIQDISSISTDILDMTVLPDPPADKMRDRLSNLAVQLHTAMKIPRRGNN